MVLSLKSSSRSQGLNRHSEVGRMKTIGGILRDGLCCNCGTCAGICPSGAIALVVNEEKGFYEPLIDETICTICGKCYDICPGYKVNFPSLNIDTFGKEPDDILVGNYRTCYLGYAQDHSIRYNAASGGAVTALLIYALEKGIIDGALVTRMSASNPFKPESFIAWTKEEILSASGSKYCPVTTNILLRDVLDSEDGMRFAVVGLPCHIQGIRMAEFNNKDLKKKIVLHIGLFCSHTDTFHQTKLLANKSKVTGEKIKEINYRAGGWPGEFSVLLNDGNKRSMPFSDAMLFHKFWINALPRCLLCYDLSAEFADISCGDPWLPDIMSDEHIGKSLIISRTKIGEELCSGAAENSYLNIKKIDPIKIKQSAKMMQTKKKDIGVRFLIRRLLNKSVPDYNTEFEEATAISYLRSIIICFNVWISSKRRASGLIELLVYIQRKFI